jgi:peroxiredoxin
VKHRLSPAFTIIVVLLFFGTALGNIPPVATFEVRASADGLQNTVILDATASHDPDGAIVVFGWDFGDGFTGSGVTKTHAYPDIGEYKVTLNVIDNDGAFHLISQIIDLSQTTSGHLPSEESPPVSVPSIVIPSNMPIGNLAGNRAPAFALSNQAGEIVQLSDFLGHVVIVEFWSSSCSACQAAMPHLEALRVEFADRGLIVVTITVNQNSEGEWQYLADHGYTQFIALREPGSAEKRTMGEYGVSRIPHAFLIDHQGVIRFTGHLNLVQSDMIELLL